MIQRRARYVAILNEDPCLDIIDLWVKRELKEYG